MNKIVMCIIGAFLVISAILDFILKGGTSVILFIGKGKAYNPEGLHNISITAIAMLAGILFLIVGISRMINDAKSNKRR